MRIVKLAMMEAESEGKKNVKVFWTTLNTALKELSGNNEYKFNPSGIMVDEAGGWWASIPEELPADVIDRTVAAKNIVNLL